MSDYVGESSRISKLMPSWVMGAQLFLAPQFVHKRNTAEHVSVSSF
jgi:predicted nucleotide-binding protein (sugar kinase/HSP70/actin superfamily)